MNDGNAAVWTLVLNRMVDVTNVTLERMTNRKEMPTEWTFVPKEL